MPEEELDEFGLPPPCPCCNDAMPLLQQQRVAH